MGSIPIGSAIDGVRPAGVLRRLAAAVYDTLLLAALFMGATFLVVATRGGEPVPAGNLPFQLLLVTIAVAFYVGFWSRGGQTLGMRAWRLRVERQSGAPLTAATAAWRLLAGILSILPLGAGLWWQWFDAKGLPWHDRLADTRVVIVPGPDGR